MRSAICRFRQPFAEELQDALLWSVSADSRSAVAI
jgi:hypothetical protein